MNMNNFVQCAIFLGVLLALAKPLGWYMAEVYEGRTPGPLRFLKSFEK